MSFDAHINLGYSTVLTAPSPAASGTTLVVAAGTGVRFPTPPFNATVWPAAVAPLPSNAEIVRVTGVTTDTLTITRAQETGAGGPAARTIVFGDQIAATLTAKTLTDIEALAAGITSDATLTTTDITTNNVSTGKHGFTPKAPNVVTQFLDGTGAWSTPSDALKANLVSPTFTGTPLAPTAAAGTNTTQLATTAFVMTAAINQTTTSTGTVNDFALTAGAMVLRCNNATLLTITGFATGVDGQRLIVESVGAGQVDFSHQAAGSTVGNRLINFASVGLTSLAPGSGVAIFVYDGTTARWRLVEHNQGAWITRTFAAGNYAANGAMTWVVASATTDRYLLIGRTLLLAFVVTGTVGGTLNTTLTIALPASLNAAATASFAIVTTPAGTQQAGLAFVAGGTVVNCTQAMSGAGNWTAGSATVNGTVQIEVQ